jgi:membrane dipeptidase
LFVVDAHEDIAWNWLEFGRDPLMAAEEGRALEANSAIPARIGQRTTGLPNWLAGRVGVIFATLFVLPQQYAAAFGAKSQTYVNAEEAHAKAQQQLAGYRNLAEQASRVRMIATRGQLEAVVQTWTAPDGAQTGQVGLVMLMEGADPIREPAEVADWYAQGLRIIGPAWRATRYAGGTGEPGALTALGYQLLEAMAELNMILDLSHMAEAAFWNAMDVYPAAMIASHSNPRRFLPTDRGLSDEMIRALAERGGVVGIVPYNRFLKPGWQVGAARSEVTVQTVVEALDAVAQLTGSVNHVGIGSDFDGGFGAESIPLEMDTVADLIKIADGLQAWGYTPAQIGQVMHGNWLRVLRDSLPAAG